MQNKKTVQPKRPKKSTIRKKSNKKDYKVRNWSEYNKSLVQRGSLELWIDKGVIKNWEIKKEEIIGKLKRGAQLKYSDKAIETTLMIGKVYNLRLRQTEGFTNSVFRLSGLVLPIPDYSTLSRRGGQLNNITFHKKIKEKVVAIVDSTGLKVYGEGEWKVRKHGWSKRRSWLKLHISIDEDGEIRAVVLTDNSVDDSQGGLDLLNQQRDDNIDEVAGDGGYDRRKFYTHCQKFKIPKIVIPPQRNARIWKHGNSKGLPHPRDENLRGIRKLGRKTWKRENGYHKRSLVENTMFRAKTIFGNRLHARNIEQQITEAMLMCKALNIMTYTGMPESYAVT